jgi:hypothetical protein
MKTHSTPLPVLTALLAACLLLPPAQTFPAPPAPPTNANHLVITEFMVKTRTPYSTFGSPFIEIHNPTGESVEMGDYYLTDATLSPYAFYYLITETDPVNQDPGGGNGGDFHARFPQGFTLAAGDTVVVSLNGSTQYQTAYGRMPDFELFEDGVAPDQVPELQEAFPGSIAAGPLGGSNVPILSDVAESIVLYRWDQSGGLVQDVDYVTWGNTNNAIRVDKTGVVMPGGAYLDDTPVAAQVPVAAAGPTFGHAFRRISADEGAEILSAGNGLTGHDETSENLNVTWANVTPADPALPLAVPFPSAPIITELSAPGSHYAWQAISLTAQVLTYGAMDQVSFFYSLDGQPFVQLSGYDQGLGRWGASVPGQPAGTQVRWYCEAVNTAGGVARSPAAAPLYLESFTVTEGPSKLLLTEIHTGPNIFPFTGMEQLAPEFIEIHNPNPDPVDLSDYYLTDAINYLSSIQLYWQIAFAGDPTFDTVGGGNYNDFTARFPEGFTIEPFQTLTISVAGSSWFQQYYGSLPDLELYEDDLEPDDVPDMRPVFINEAGDLPGDSIYTPNRPAGSDGLPRGLPELEEYYGEVVILYFWDGQSDLVTDVDVFFWGPAQLGDYRTSFDKTGVTVGESTYQPDTPVPDQDWPQTDLFGPESWSRLDPYEGTQPEYEGNGVQGRDETGENLSDTFYLFYPTPGFFNPGGEYPPAEGDWQNVATGALADTLDNGVHLWGDLDGDGDDDLLLISGLWPSRVLNNQGGFNFTEVSVGLTANPSAMDASLADCDNDGLLDLFVATYEQPNLFWRGTSWGDPFEFVPEFYPTLDPANVSLDADWIDLDLDGHLEAYVSNWGVGNQLLLSRYGFVDDVPADLQLPGPVGAFHWGDLDGDLDADLALVTTTGEVHVLTRTGPRQFQDTVISVQPEAVACSLADFDNDGDSDLFVASSALPNILFENLGSGSWQEAQAGVFFEPTQTVGAVWGDYDNDGYQDLFEFNRNDANRLLRNLDGTGHFERIYDSQFTWPNSTGCATWQDTDRDGDLDLYLSQSPDPNRLIRNNLDNGNSWLTVRAKGYPGGLLSNSCALGAIIRVETAEQTQWRFVSAGQGAPGQTTFDQHFGLGTATVVDRVTVYWPFELPWGGRHTTQLQDVAVNQRLVITEDAIGVSPVPETVAVPAAFALGAGHPNPFNPVTVIPFDLPRPETVTLQVFDLRGRLVRTLLGAESRQAGSHQAVWNGMDDRGQPAAAGVYLVKMRAGEFQAGRRVSLVK